MTFESIGRSGRGPSSGATLLPSAARTTAPANIEFDNPFAGIEVDVDITAIAATPLVTVNIERLDAASGKWLTLLTSAALGAVATTRLRIHPRLTAAANVTAQDRACGRLRTRITVADADSATYSVGAVAIP